MRTAEKRRISSYDLYVFLILVAFEIIMSFTFFGYIHISPISITFAYIPVLVAACILGTAQSTVMGVIFGLASMYKSTAWGVYEADKLFSPFLSGNPVGSLILSVGARTGFGLLTGLVFQTAKKSRHKKTWIGVISAVSPTVQALLVMLVMQIFFHYAVQSYFHMPYLVISNILSAALCVLLMEILWKVHNSQAIKDIKTAVDGAGQIPYMNPKRKRILVSVFTLFIFGMTLAVALYFADRMTYMLEMHHLPVSTFIKSDMVHLQAQFMAAVFSINVISIVVLNMGYQYTSYKRFLGELDAVTGIMGRRVFLNCCERAQQTFDPQRCTEGWFLLLDVDHFKTINDTLGHVAGDSVLKEVALTLKNMFSDYGIAGRMGGDEFAVMIDKKALSAEELQSMLDRFFIAISAITEKTQSVTCSIGVCRFSFPADVELLMDKTDTLLYKAKENGRACYVFDENMS